MPQKFRQRGKKKKSSNAAELAAPVEEDLSSAGLQGAGREWQHEDDFVPLGEASASASTSADVNTAPPHHTPLDYPDADAEVAPFGFVPPELKSYLKDAHANLQRLDAEAAECNGYHSQAGHGGDDDEAQGQERVVLRRAMLREMDGQELACATDGECSVVLEAVLAGLDARRLRILADRVTGSCATLASHRFGSHVLQSILRGLQQGLLKDSKGKNRLAADEAQGSTGVLRNAEQLICEITRELIPEAQFLVQGTFATHVIRSLLLLLSGQDISIDTSSRSKKSAAFRNKAVAPEQQSQQHHHRDGVQQHSSGLRPNAFKALLRQLREASVPQDSTGRNEARALLVSASASPTFALLLSLEAQAGESDRAGSLADIVLEGMISEPQSTDSKDGVETLLRHPSGSHALEGILAHATPELADRFLSIYAKGKMTRLGSHPVANFVIAKTIKRASAKTVQEAIADIQESGGSKMVKDAKTGLFLALVERSGKRAEDVELQQLTMDVILASFGFDAGWSTLSQDPDAVMLAFKSILALKTKSDYKKMLKRRAEKAAKASASASNGDSDVDGNEHPRKRKRVEDTGDDDALRDEDVTVQGSLLLQAISKLDEPSNHLIFTSLTKLTGTTLAYAQNATSSHIYLSALSSPTSSYQQRRSLNLSLLPHIPALADSKYASRISDMVFARSDGFLKEKILKSIVEGGNERFLQSSFYGRFFLKKVGWAQWRKDAFAWKSWVKALPAEPLAHRLGHEEEQEEKREHEDADVDGLQGKDDGAKKRAKKQNRTKEQAELEQILSGV